MEELGIENYLCLSDHEQIEIALQEPAVCALISENYVLKLHLVEAFYVVLAYSAPNEIAGIRVTDDMVELDPYLECMDVSYVYNFQ